MKKLFYGVMGAALLMVSCLNPTPTDYFPYIVGEWVNVASAGSVSVTDSIKVLNFKSDKSFTYAYGKPATDDRMIWTEGGNGWSYSVTDQFINIVSPAAGSSVEPTTIRLEIVYVDNLTMTCVLVDYTVGGVQKAEGQLLGFEKSYDLIKNQISGIWQRTNGASQDQWYWDFKARGFFDFYIYDPVNRVYKEKVLDKSSYKVYGRYLVCIFSDSVTGGAAGESANVWLISSFDGPSMNWTATNAEGEVEYFFLSRTGMLPE